MPNNKPIGKCTVQIDGLGQIEGWQYSNGVRQFSAIPYATLSKRWTRSVLKRILDDGFHDGTKLGPRCPHPEFEGDHVDELTPVPPLPHFNTPDVDERSALVLNAVLPPETARGPHPIFVYVHGGSLLYGGAHLAMFDSVRLVSQSVDEVIPIIAINFNYRVGLGGFLASAAVATELAKDGHQGGGNFGFTDQKVAFDWIQAFGAALGGDIENMAACGESAGGISISNQLLAESPPTFHRAICMSWFKIDPKAEDVLDRLREIPKQELANARPAIFGVGSGTGNPCLDGVFYQQSPFDLHAAPSWLKSYMIGDVYHEGVIFHLNILNDTYDLWHDVFLRTIQDETIVSRSHSLGTLLVNSACLVLTAACQSNLVLGISCDMSIEPILLVRRGTNF